MVTETVEIYSRQCIGCTRSFMVMANSPHVYCSMGCKHMNPPRRATRPTASTSKTVTIMVPEPLKHKQRAERKAMLRQAYREKMLSYMPPDKRYD